MSFTSSSPPVLPTEEKKGFHVWLSLADDVEDDGDDDTATCTILGGSIHSTFSTIAPSYLRSS